MRIPVLGLLAILILGTATADGEFRDNESSKKLLSTLQKMHSSLSAQIVEVAHMEAVENSEKIHLLQHYTAQRNNVEHEIASIQSIDASHEVAAPRHILKNLSPEEKTVPSFLNIFKKPKNPGQEHLNENTENSLPPYYPGYGQQYPYPYGQPTMPDQPYPSNDLVQGTFTGYEPQNNNNNQQTFLNREQPTQSYQTPPAEQVSLQVSQQYTPPPQITLQPLAQPPQPDPQGEQPQMEPYISQAVPQQQQYQRQPQYTPQTVAQQQQYQPQAQLEPYRPNQEEQQVLRPQPTQNMPQLGPTPDFLQQSPFGQTPGVFIYYPNGVMDEAEKERPTIADRFGQAFNRVGQVISSLTNRPNFRSSSYVSATNQISEKLPERRRVTHNKPRSSMKDGMFKVKSMTPSDQPMMPIDTPIMSMEKPMMPRDIPMMPTDKPMMPMAKRKMRWVSV